MRSQNDGVAAERLYLNPNGFQVFPQLRCILMVNDVHAEAARVFQVQGAVIHKNALLRNALRDFQRDAINGLFWLAGIEVAGAEEGLKIFAEVKCFDAVLVQLQRLVIDGRHQVFAGLRERREHRAGVWILPGLRKHERGELFAGEGAGAVEEGAVQILVQSDLASVKRREREIMAVLKIFPIELERLGGFTACIAVPAVGEDDAADIKEERGDGWHRKSSEETD